MKNKLIFAILTILSFSVQNTKAQTSDTTVNALLAIDESRFVNKPLDSIIAALPPGYISMKIFSGGHLYTARCVAILYPNRVWIDLYVNHFMFMNPVDPNRIWDITLMRKENLFHASIYKHTDCYLNCDIR